MSIKIDRPDSASGPTVSRRSLVKIDYELCERTGACASVCPENVFEHNDGHTHIVKGEACTECWICVDNCVSSAITIG